MSFQNISESEIEGYNDCPVVDLSKRTVSSSSVRRKRLIHDLSNVPTRSSTPTIPMPVPISKMKKTREKTQEVEVSDEQVTSLIQETFSKESKLPDKEFNHYIKKIQQNLKIESLGNNNKTILIECINDFNKNKLMTLILNNDGYGSWCLPLIKVLENIK